MGTLKPLEEVQVSRENCTRKQKVMDQDGSLGDTGDAKPTDTMDQFGSTIGDGDAQPMPEDDDSLGEIEEAEAVVKKARSKPNPEYLKRKNKNRNLKKRIKRKEAIARSKLEAGNQEQRLPNSNDLEYESEHTGIPGMWS